MTRLYGWAPRGRRLVAKVPHGHWKTATFLAALRNDRIEAPPEFWGEVQPPASLKGLDIPSRRAVFVPWKPSRRPAFGMGNPTFR